MYCSWGEEKEAGAETPDDYAAVTPGDYRKRVVLLMQEKDAVISDLRARLVEALKSAADIADAGAREIMMNAIKSELKQYATKG